MRKIIYVWKEPRKSHGTLLITRRTYKHIILALYMRLKWDTFFGLLFLQKNTHISRTTIVPSIFSFVQATLLVSHHATR